MASWEPDNVVSLPERNKLAEEQGVPVLASIGSLHERGEAHGSPSLTNPPVRSESDPSGEPQRESVQVEAIPSRASLTLSDPGALGSASNESSPESITEIADGILERMTATERELELAWARLRRTLRGA